MSTLEQEIIDTIAEEGGIEKECIHLDSDLYSLGIDSLSALEIIAVLEIKFNIRISEYDLRNVNQIRGIVQIVSKEVKKRECH